MSFTSSTGRVCRVCHSAFPARGARIVRLDAIAYLWKKPVTTCIHLRQTHAVVKLIRALLDALAPETLLLTETNVPHAENVSCFGDGDEARMIYQFSLGPLMLDAFVTGEGTPLMTWLSGLAPADRGTTCLNFTASHDGVGVRLLEGLVARSRVEALVRASRERGGGISLIRNPDGTQSPYELNITWFSATAGDPVAAADVRSARRFLTSQAIMLALRGIPGVYFHSLVGTPNDHAGVRRTGRPRSINRRRFTRSEIDQILADETATQRRVFDGYRRLLSTRVDQSAFHPDSDQDMIAVDDPAIVAFQRTSLDARQRIVVVPNLASQEREISLPGSGEFEFCGDLLGADAMPNSSDSTGHRVSIPADDVLWLNYVR